MSPDDPNPRHPCTAEYPAPPGKNGRWDLSWDHPEAVGRCINDDHDDWKYVCPHCGCSWIYEGPDA